MSRVTGCGYWGPNLIRNFRALPDCNLKIMCDLNPARLKHLGSLYPEVAGTTDYRHMLNGVNLDAVVIATGVGPIIRWPGPACSPANTRSSKNRWRVPSAHCEELVDIARKNGLVLMTGHTFLYSPVVRKIKEIIDSGRDR